MSTHQIDASPFHRPGTRRRSRILAALIGLATALIPLQAGASVGGHPPIRATAHRPAHVLRRLVPRGTALPAATPLTDHGGRLLPTAHLYAIWWGPAAGFPSDAVSGLTSFFNGIGNSGYLGVARQYLRGAAVSTGSVTNLADGTRPPSQVTAATLGAEVGRLTRQKPDPLGIYFVFTSNFPTGANFCAWHDAATVGGRRIAVAYMPNTSSAPGCDAGNQFGLPWSAGTRSLANVTAHELLETITDADPNTRPAWLDAAGQEIGDKCAWMFSAPVTLSNGSVWQLQQEWSNAKGACVQS